MKKSKKRPCTDLEVLDKEIKYQFGLHSICCYGEASPETLCSICTAGGNSNGLLGWQIQP